MRYARLLVCWGAMCGCGPAKPEIWGSMVNVPDGPATGRVVFVNGAGAVVAEAPIVNGHYQLATRPAALTAQFQLEAPVIGAREVKLTDNSPPTLEIGTVATLKASIEVPDSVTFDWVDIEITPLGPPRAFQPKFKRHLTAPRTELRLIDGAYLINVSRDASEATGGAKLVLDRLEAAGSSSAVTRLRNAAGAVFQVQGGTLGAGFILRRER
jgi:hypothetical protein